MYIYFISRLMYSLITLINLEEAGCAQGVAMLGAACMLLCCSEKKKKRIKE